MRPQCNPHAPHITTLQPYLPTATGNERPLTKTQVERIVPTDRVGGRAAVA